MLTANHVFLRVKDTRQDVFIARSMQFIAVAHRRGSGFSSVVNSRGLRVRASQSWIERREW